MVNINIEKKAEQFCSAWQGLNMIYEDYARVSGISYTTLYILNAIIQFENCTQQMICRRTLLPKQTVNSVVTNFYKQGYVELSELPENRRIKVIRLTVEGKKYADTLIPHIQDAECKAMKQLTTKQQDSLLEAMELYCAAFRKEMLRE
jgi:DNA-binding MarR family transcriptional regulator